MAGRRWVVGPWGDGRYSIRCVFDTNGKVIERHNRDHAVVYLAADELSETDFLELIVVEQAPPPRRIPTEPSETENPEATEAAAQNVQRPQPEARTDDLS